MIKFSFISMMLLSIFSFAQQSPSNSGSIFGKITDKTTNEEIPFVMVFCI
ncbi:MAG: hypothetical protein IPL10_15895 [Bacteroidetes bacterium]|nr:hypothetical protein [Bacteroidota bacterium]